MSRPAIHGSFERWNEQRVEAHNRFADALKAAGIRYRDRDHVSRIAYRIVKEEL